MNEKISKLKAYLENHIGVLLASVIITTGSITYSVAHYFHNKELVLESLNYELVLSKKDMQLEAFNARLSSIAVGIGADSIMFDLRKRLVKNDDMNKLSPKLTHYENNNFYLDERGLEGLEHKYISEKEINMMLYDNKIQSMLKDNNVERALSLTTVDLWYNSKSDILNVSSRVMPGKNATRMLLFPFVGIYRLNYSDCDNLIDDILCDTSIVNSELDTVDASILSTTNQKLKYSILEKLYDPSICGRVIASEVNGGLNQADAWKNVKYRVVKLQKIDNALYIRSQYVFSNLDQQNNNIIWDRELIVLITNNSYIVIQTSIPSIDGRSTDYAWVRKWMNSVFIPCD